ncbi:MAG: YggS family pyridoxal phosphate-dependent enzyme [Methyloligellaceae bacterium]
MNKDQTPTLKDSPRERIEAVEARIRAAAERTGRDPAQVKLIAVSKTFYAHHIEPVIAAGQTRFGENRVQEALAKWPALKARHPEVELHLIGPLQSNKARDAVELFDVIHTIDRPKIASAIAREIEQTGRTPRLFVQVNTGEEEQKAGVLPGGADAFLKQCRDEFGLNIEGLMSLPPLDEEASLHFALLNKIAARNGVSELSMGMSADFENAVALGATYVRVGTAIFGPRG